MKDELQELEMDESTRKTATDWLMHVISGKRANSNGNGNGSSHSEHSGSGGAVAVAEMPEMEMPHAPEPTQEFTAEDLCGAPVIPVIKVRPKDEITADDVCWVPEEMRLRPQPPVEEQAVTSNLHIMPSPEIREDLGIQRQGAPRDPELSFLTGADAAVTAADISREPAPYMVEPTWNAMDSGPEMREITAADLMRESVRNYMPDPGGSDMPTSFRVMRSAAPAPRNPVDAPTIEAPAPVAEVAPIIEVVTPVPEPPVVEVAAPSNETAVPLVEKAPEVEAALPGVETPITQVATDADIPAVAPAAHTEASVIESQNGSAELSAPAAEINFAEVSSAEEDAADAHEIEAALAHPEDLPEPELPVELQPELGAAVQQDVKGDAAENINENVFAREGFWGGATGKDAGKDEVASKAMLRGMKRAYTAASDSADFEKHPEGWFSAWKTMLRLGSVLPWVARALPALESGALDVEPGAMNQAGASGATGVAQETRQDVAGLRLVQYEIRTTVQDHSMQLKRMEEQLTRVRESVDSRSSENAEVAENLRAMTKLMRFAGMGLGALLLVLIVLVIVMLAHR